MLKVSVLASGRGSNFRALYEALKDGKSNARIVAVISNNSDAGALELARSFHLPAIHLSQKQFPSPEEFTAALLRTLESHGTDLIVLAGYMKQLPAQLVRTYKYRILNIHPALLPAYGGKGMYGHFVHEAVIKSGARKSGATVHFVDEEYDHGAILLQDTVDVDPADTPDTLAEKVLEVEHRLLPRAVKLIAAGKVEVRNGTVHITSE